MTLFNLAVKVVRLAREMSDVMVIRDTAKHLYLRGAGALYKALSAEASTAYGLSPVFIVHDELGQVKGPASELTKRWKRRRGAASAALDYHLDPGGANPAKESCA